MDDEDDDADATRLSFLYSLQDFLSASCEIEILKAELKTEFPFQ